MASKRKRKRKVERSLPRRGHLQLERLESRILLTNAWTILTYINADNNLEIAGVDDVNEMESVELPEDVDIVALFDRIQYPVWYYDDTSNGDWTDTRIGIIEHDTDPVNFATDFQPFDTTDGDPEEDMGDPQTLLNFINRGMAMAPAENYMLILWDHGSALEGFSFDETSGYSYLTPKDIGDVVAMADDHIDIVGFDGCLMGLVEMAHELKDSSDVFIAAETTIPWDGWGYQYFLDDLAADSTMSASELAGHVVDGYGELYGNAETLSAIDLHQMDDLATELDEFAADVMGAGLSDEEWRSFNRAIARVPEYFGGENYRDLGRFMRNVSRLNINQAVVESAFDVLDVYNGMVIANHTGSFEQATGMCIMLPRADMPVPEFYTGNSFAFVSDHLWDEFLRREDIGTIEVTPPRVVDFQATDRMVLVTFSEVINIELITATDAYVTTEAGDPVSGELRWQSGGRVLQWLADDVLAPGLYEMTLLGQDTTNFVDFDNTILDGDYDGEPGGNYVEDWAVGDAGLLTEVGSMTTSGITIRLWDTTVLNAAESNLQLATPDTFNSRVSDVLVIDNDPDDDEIDGIYLYTHGLRGMGLSIEYATDDPAAMGSVREIIDRRGEDEVAAPAFFASEVPVGSFSLGSGISGYDLNGRTLSDSFIMPDDADQDGEVTDPVALYAPAGNGLDLDIDGVSRGDIVVGSARRADVYWLGGGGDFWSAGDVQQLSVGGSDGWSDIIVDGWVPTAGFGPFSSGDILAMGFGRINVDGNMRQVSIEATDGGIDTFSITGIFEGGLVTDDAAGAVRHMRFGDDVNAVIHVASVDAVDVMSGSLDGSFEVLEELGMMRVRNGDLLAQVGAESIGQLQVMGMPSAAPVPQEGGNIEGNVSTSDGDATAVIVRYGSVNGQLNIAGHLQTLYVINGNITAGVTAQSAGSVIVRNGSMTVPEGEQVLNVTDGNADRVVVLNGNVNGGISVDGDVMQMAVIGGNADVDLDARRVSRFLVRAGAAGGGDLLGNVNVDRGLSVLYLSGGDLTANVTADSIDRLVVASARGAGGSIIDSNINVADSLLRVQVTNDLVRTDVLAQRIGQLHVRGYMLGSDPGPSVIAAETGSFIASASNLARQTIDTAPVTTDGGLVVLRVGD